MAATANVEYWKGATATATSNIESASPNALYFNKSDDITTTTTPITVPASAGTNYSFVKWTSIYVTTAAATTLTNLSVQLASGITTGLAIFACGLTTYVQAGTSTAVMTDNGTTDVTGSGTAPTITGTTSTRTSNGSAFVYDATGGSANVTNQKVGLYCALVFGVGNSYTGGAGSAIALPNITYAYDEAMYRNPFEDARIKAQLPDCL